MVSPLKSDEGSEPDLDLNLQLSDTETEDYKETLNESGDIDESVLLESDNNEDDNNLEEDNKMDDLEDVVNQGEDAEDQGEDEQPNETNADIEDFLDAEIIVKADFKKEKEKFDNEESSNSNLESHSEELKDAPEIEDISSNEASKVESNVGVSAQGSPQPESKDDDGDLLLVMDEKAADLDATEYEKSVAEQAEQDSEDSGLKDDTLNCVESSKSPPSVSGNEESNGNEESEDKTDRNSPDDLMDIGDSILDIGETAPATASEEVVEKVPPEETSEATVDEKLGEETEDQMEVDEAQKQAAEEDINEEEKKVEEPIQNGEESLKECEDEVKDVVAIEEETPELIGETLEDKPDENDAEIIKIVVEQEAPIILGRGKRKKQNGRSSSLDKESDFEDLSTPPITSDGDSNKENVGEVAEIAETVAAVKTISTRSLRKRVSADSCELNDSKKFKSNNIELNSKSNGSLSPSSDYKFEETPNNKHELELSLSQLLDNTDLKSDSKPKLEQDSKVSFKKILSDTTLRGLNRESLEALVVQKICESLVYKTRISNLMKCLKDRDGTIDTLQKEVNSLNKQSKDLYIVHEKILQDLQRFKKNPEKPLLVPRITRSVGLQAGTKDTTKRKSLPPPAPLLSVAPPLAKIAPRPTPANVMSPTASTQVPKVPPQPVVPKQNQVVVSPRPAPKTPKASPTKPILNKVVAPKSDKKVVATTASTGGNFIDLTSDDDKKVPTSTSSALQKLPNGTKILQPPNGHKFVLVNGQSVLVKMPPNQGNIVLNSGAMKVIASSGTPVRAIQPSILRTTNSANTKTTPTNARTSMISSPIVSTPQRPIKPANKVTKTKHPAPFPISTQRNIPSNRPSPPRPQLTLTKTECGTGIILSWKINSNLDLFSEIASYQIYAYQETKAEPRSENWSKIGDVKALQLPMAVTLTQFVAHHRYFFAVRAVDVLTRVGPFSEYQTI